MKKLAIFGGKKIRSKPMPFREAFGFDERRSLQKVVSYYKKAKKDPIYKGKFEKSFSSKFNNYMGGGYSVPVSTGTGSVFVAIETLNLKKGSEVIISPIVDAGPLNCLIYLGYKPVVADSAPSDYNSNASQFLRKVTKNTSAILVVHAIGQSIKIEEIIKKTRKRKIKIIEDFSQSPGSHIDGKKVGTLGDVAACSTMYSKSLTMGCSGGIVFSSKKNTTKIC